MATKKKTVVALQGEDSPHSSSELTQLKKLLTYLLIQAGLSGTFQVKTSRRRVRGSSHTKGLSIGHLHQMGVEIYFQPGGNDTRHTYYLIVDPAQKESIKQKLDAVCPKVLATIPKKKQAKQASQTVKAAGEKVPTACYIEGFTATNVKHAQKFARIAAKRAKGYPNEVLPKREVTQLLSDMMGVASKAVGPQVKSLKARGYLVWVEESDGFLVDSKPPVSPKKKTSSAGQRSGISPTKSQKEHGHTRMSQTPKPSAPHSSKSDINETLAKDLLKIRTLKAKLEEAEARADAAERKAAETAAALKRAEAKLAQQPDIDALVQAELVRLLEEE